MPTGKLQLSRWCISAVEMVASLNSRSQSSTQICPPHSLPSTPTRVSPPPTDFDCCKSTRGPVGGITGRIMSSSCLLSLRSLSPTKTSSGPFFTSWGASPPQSPGGQSPAILVVRGALSPILWASPSHTQFLTCSIIAAATIPDVHLSLTFTNTQA